MLYYALAYRSDFSAPTLKRRAPDEREAAALRDLDARLAALPQGAAADAIQSEVFEAGKAAGFEPLRDWFKALYETLLGSSQGPRMGRSEEHTSELQSLMRISYAVFCLKKKKKTQQTEARSELMT